MASATAPGPIFIPARRRARAKYTMLSASFPSPGGIGGENGTIRPMFSRLHRQPAASSSALTSASSLRPSAPSILAMSSWVFEQGAERIGDRFGIEREPVELGQGRRPVDRLGDTRVLEEIDGAKPLHIGDDFA